MLCTECGTTLTPPHQPDEEGKTRSSGRRGLLRYLLVSGIALVIFVGVLAGAIYAGLYYGERDRDERRQETVETHYKAGIEALNDGRYERALAEFEYVLGLDETHVLAQQGVTEAQARLSVKPTPTLEAARSLAQQLLEQAQDSYETGDWETAAQTLTQLRALDPGYAQEEVETLLYTSLYSTGMSMLDEDRLEEGIFYLDQAVALRPLDAETVNQRTLAARYLAALGYWGVDWELCIQRFEELYASAPGYKDVSQRLYQAYLAHADHLAEQGELCPAELQYTQALRLFADAGVDQKRAAAAQICLIATPTPISGTMALMTPQPGLGTPVGRLAYPVYNSSTGSYDIYALYSDGRILRAAIDADQPWWEWGMGRLVYRDRSNGGVGMVLPEEGVPLQRLAPAGQAWPTLSPDGQRIAYAAPAENGVWHIYIQGAHGEDAPQRLAPGWAPAWGTSGKLAYTGCDPQGTCGIIVDDPNDGQPGTRLTSSESDTAVAWAPGGNQLAYMTNVTGNWDIFLLGLQGGVQQLTEDPSNEGLPVWAPDGSSLAFVSDRHGGWGIYVMQPNGQNVRRLVDLGSTMPGWDNQRLSWAP